MKEGKPFPPPLAATGAGPPAVMVLLYTGVFHGFVGGANAELVPLLAADVEGV